MTVVAAMLVVVVAFVLEELFVLGNTRDERNHAKSFYTGVAMVSHFLLSPKYSILFASR